MSQIEEVLIKLFGRPARPAFSSSSLAVGLSASVLARQNPNRLYLGIFNSSAADVFIAPFQQVAPSYGVLVPPNGGSVVLTAESDLVLPSLEWSAIATAAASPIFVIEQSGVPAQGGEVV